jgi:hypothetical protein
VTSQLWLRAQHDLAPVNSGEVWDLEQCLCHLSAAGDRGGKNAHEFASLDAITRIGDRSAPMLAHRTEDENGPPTPAW